MPVVQFGSVSADMQQETNWYGIPVLQDFNAFTTAFVPVNAVAIVSSPTVQVLRETDANGQIEVVSFLGNLAGFSAFEIVVEAEGLRAVLDGSFTLNGGLSVSGTVTSQTVTSSATGALIYAVSGISVPLSGLPHLVDTDDPVVLAGNDTVAGGTGNDFLLGYEGNDLIQGGAGNNTLDGGLGADTLSGGVGRDTFVVDSDLDVISDTGGVDKVLSPVDWVLGPGLESLTLTGDAAINGTGNELNNQITGNAANNVLDGGAGNDAMAGGLGDDTYVVDSALDTIGDTGGVDTVQSSVTWTLKAGLENLTLTGVAAINGAGNALDNVITGNSGNNVLDGGTGTDTLSGGLGDDTFVVDNAADVVRDTGGVDTVQASVTRVLGAGLENLILTGASAIDGAGNALDNVITGNDGNNVLNGGAGNDTLSGGLGDDTFVVDSTLDQLSDAGGVDKVVSSVAWVLGAGFENLTLNGNANINGIGNTLDNLITGNAGNNLLNGGAGNDTLRGGLGNDTFVVNSALDAVSDTGGVDTVQAGVNWVLGAGLEKLVLLGSADINGTGNTLANTITGNGGNNLLDGAAGNDTLVGGLGNDVLVGGAGTDSMVGGGGADRFDFNQITDSGVGISLRDVLEDFTSAQGDRINLSAIDANPGVAGDQAFAFIGSAAFTDVGQVRFEGGVLQANVDGTLGADMEVLLSGVTALAGADLIL